MPTVADWRRLSVPKRHRLDERIAELETRCDKPHPVQRLRLPVTAHLRALKNPHDRAAALGAGARYLLGDTTPTITSGAATAPRT